MKKFISNKFAAMTIAENRFFQAPPPVATPIPTATINTYNISNNLQNNEFECTHVNLIEAAQEQSRLSPAMPTVSNWKKTEFLQWIGSIFMTGKEDLENLSLESFFRLTDDEVAALLTRMDVKDFKNLDSEYGELMYIELRKLDGLNGNPINMNESPSVSDDSNSSTNSMPFIPIANNTKINTFNNFNERLSEKVPRIKTQHHISSSRIGDGGKVIKPDKKTKDCVHVWQFCRDLLQDSQYNPAIIQWLDESQLVFKINNKERIAFLWGLKKNRKNPEKMTYENMSRGMRHSRVASDYFRVPDKKHKKKFVYQFGTKAIENCPYLSGLYRANK